MIESYNFKITLTDEYYADVIVSNGHNGCLVEYEFDYTVYYFGKTIKFSIMRRLGYPEKYEITNKAYYYLGMNWDRYLKQNEK